jgi:glycine/D-amino acid oxidase-like deaminating enzyme
MVIQKSFWLDVPYRPRKPLNQNLHTDVAIVGGGITGVSAAYHCAKAGFRTVLVEKNTLASGASGKNEGMVVEGTEVDFHQHASGKGLKHAQNAWELTQKARDYLARCIRTEKIACDVKRSGSLFVALDEHQDKILSEEAAARKRQGYRCTLLDGSGLAKLAHTRFHSALFTPQDFALDPVKLVRGWARRAELRGARIYERTPATAFNHHSVSTQNGSSICFQ